MTPRIAEHHGPELRALGQRLARAAALCCAASSGAVSAVEAVELLPSLPPGVLAIATDDESGLDSVLASEREGAPLGADELPDLEPISEFSTDAPELAAPQSLDAPPEASAAAPEPRSNTLPPGGDRVATLVTQAGLDFETNPGPKPAKFHGVTPGVSQRGDLLAAWGEPDRIGKADGETDGGQVLGYDLPSFDGVEVLVESDRVSAIRVALQAGATVKELVERLKLSAIERVEVGDRLGDGPLAIVFPEKGLTMLLSPGASELIDPADATVSHLVLESLDERVLVLRAERRPTQHLTAKLRDLGLALEVDPRYAHALWLRAAAHLAGGQSQEAAADAAEAVRLAPRDAAYRVTLAESLLGNAEFDRAVLETRKVLDDTTAPEIARAQALALMGRLSALGPAKLSAKTIDFHNAAIEIADRLATSADDRERRLAKGVLVASHLDIAKEVARRDYADKAETVAQWLGRASAIAEDWIESDGGGLELRLRVACDALAALAELRPSKDPAPWIAEAREAAETLVAGYEDPLFRAAVRWDLGEAYQHAVRIEHLRGDARLAIDYGTRAIDELSAGAATRSSSPAAERLVGRLYFYLGAVNAVHNKDHAEAVVWYDRGREALTAERPASEFVVPRRDGEELVSMGVSYWAEGQRDLAIELTESGARQMERGVSAGVIDGSTLSVPYGNLETMHAAMANAAKSAEYARLARGVRGFVPSAASDNAPAEPVAKQQAPRKSPRQARRGAAAR